MENKQKQGTDLRFELTITPKEAAQGCQKEIELPRWETCSHCRGNGAQPGTSTTRCSACQGSGKIRLVQPSIFGQFVNLTTCERCRGEGRVIPTPCEKCRGQGRVRNNCRIAFTIPAGVEDGTNVRLTGAGDAGPSGSPPGNLYVVLHVPSAVPTSTPPVPQERLAEDRVTAVWKVGDLIDDQSEVRAILGEGGMGTVYRVYFRPWNREVAVKCPRPEIFARADGKEHFIQEAETWTALEAYPHIVRGYFVRTFNGIPHVFAEYVPGGSLSEWIARRRLYAGGPEQALSRILDIAIQFAWGLHFAHERGLVHQDVKPANVMMTEEGMAKVTDFGLAKARLLAGEGTIALGSGKASLLVSSRGMTPAYCSPEQAAGRPLNRKSDLWSWGVSVLEMFVGEVSWRVGVVAREVLASYKALDPALPVMPEAVIGVLSSCFQQEPDARPATMLAVATELQRIYVGCVGRRYPRAMPASPEIRAGDLVNRGVSLQDLGRFEEALAVLEEALRLDPNVAVAHAVRGLVLNDLGRFEEALAALEQALRLDPNDAATHQNRGNVLRRLGRLEEALAALEQALRLNPTYAPAHAVQGLALADLGRREEALAAFEQALRLNPNDAATHHHWGLVLFDLGRREEALAAFDQALRLDPNHADAHAGRGVVLADLGRREEALAAFEQALRLNPNDAVAHTGRGLVLRQLGRLEEAEQAFQRARALQSQS